MAREVDVLIVGGGLMGLSLACALKNSHLTVALVDGGPMPKAAAPDAPSAKGHHLNSGFDARVSALSLASHDFISRVGAWPTDRVCAFTEMLVWDARGNASIKFDAHSIGEQALGYIVENRNVLYHLLLSAEAAETLALQFDTRVRSIEKIESGYELTTETGEAYRCALLVGADGGNSIVREACNVRGVGWQYGQDALVSTIQTELPHGGVARQCFTREGPLAFLPLANEGERLCSIVWSTAISESLLALDDEAICDRLTRASESVLGRVVAIDRRFSFPLRQQHSLRYVREHLALVGDAAHTIHPLAGQGANIGLADANTLAIILNDCRFTDTGPGDIRMLRRYERTRQPANVMMAAVMEGFKHLYTPDYPAINWLRNAGTRLVDGNPALKSIVARLAGGR